MADPVSLALAIAPLTLEVIKGFRALDSKLRIFHHYSREIGRIETRFSAQRDFFQSECEILLRKVAWDSAQVNIFLEARQLDGAFYRLLEELSVYLGKRFSVFKSTFEEIRNLIQELEDELKGFEKIEEQRKEVGLHSPVTCIICSSMANFHEKGETLKEAVRRLRYRIKITLNKSSYDKALNQLKESNYDLMNIRKHAADLSLQGSKSSTQLQRAMSVKPLPAECRAYVKVRKAAVDFYEAMNTSWVCEGQAHSRHIVRLFTNAEVQQEVKMNFLLLGDYNYHRQSSEPKPCPTLELGFEDNLIPDKANPELRSPDQFLLEVRSSIIELSDILQHQPFIRSSSLHVDISDPRVAKRRKVMWADQNLDQAQILTNQPQLFSPIDNNNNIAHSKSHRIKPIKEISSKTLGCVSLAGCHRTQSFLGYLEAKIQRSYCHSIYNCPNQLAIPKGHEPAITTPINTLFDHPIDEHYDIRDQLELAKSMVSIVLKFHSTPWLEQWWTLKDVCFLSVNYNMDNVLKTLHLGASLELEHRQQYPSPNSSILVDEDQRLESGIQNMALYNLGVALLQVDRWTNLDPNDTANIYKLATWSRIGPRYRDIVQRCLHCNFGVDYDLSRPKLQTAVSERVIGELEKMIKGLTICNDEHDEDQVRRQ